MQPRRGNLFLGWAAAASLAGLATTYAAPGGQASPRTGETPNTRIELKAIRIETR